MPNDKYPQIISTVVGEPLETASGQGSTNVSFEQPPFLGAQLQPTANNQTRYISAMEMPTNLSKEAIAQRVGLGIVATLAVLGVGVGIGLNLPHDASADKNHQPDVPAVADRKDAKTLALSPEAQTKLNHAATQTVQARIDTVKDHQKGDPMPGKPYMHEGKFNFFAYQDRSVSGKSYDKEETAKYVVATPKNTTDGLKIEVVYSDSTACYDTKKSELESRDCAYKSETYQVLSFVNPGSKVFDDRKLTLGELEEYLKDSQTVFTSGSKTEREVFDGNATGYERYEVEVKDGKAVVDSSSDPTESLEKVTNQ